MVQLNHLNVAAFPPTSVTVAFGGSVMLVMAASHIVLPPTADTVAATVKLTLLILIVRPYVVLSSAGKETMRVTDGVTVYMVANDVFKIA